MTFVRFFVVWPGTSGVFVVQQSVVMQVCCTNLNQKWQHQQQCTFRCALNTLLEELSTADTGNKQENNNINSAKIDIIPSGWIQWLRLKFQPDGDAALPTPRMTANCNTLYLARFEDAPWLFTVQLFKIIELFFEASCHWPASVSLSKLT